MRHFRRDYLFKEVERMSAENVVAVIIRDIPQMTAYTEELVEFMQKVQSLRRKMTKARMRKSSTVLRKTP